MVSIVLMGRTIRIEANDVNKREKLRATDWLPAYIVPTIGLGSRLSIDWGKDLGGTPLVQLDLSFERRKTAEVIDFSMFLRAEE